MFFQGVESREIWGLVDCDSFYASCETYLHPEYKGRPVCVGGDIIIARNYIAREYGIKVGMPIWEAKKRLPTSAIFCRPDMREYGRISERLNYWLGEVCNEVEEYSIDESFINATGLDRHHKISFNDIARKMKIQIKRDIGIPVSIGLAHTRILAKIFADAYKPYGDYVGFDSTRIDYVLEQLPVSDIPYIGRQSAQKLSYLCTSALDFKNLDAGTVRKKLGGSGFKIWCELNGISARKPSNNKTPKSITRSRSFNPDFTSDKDELWSHLYKNIEKAHEELMDHSCVTSYIALRMRLKDFSHIRREVRLPSHTNDKLLIVKEIRKLFDGLPFDMLYRTTGVIFSQLQKQEITTPSLFDVSEKLEIANITISTKPNFNELNNVIYNINKRFGRGIIQIGTSQSYSGSRIKDFPVAFEVS